MNRDVYRDFSAKFTQGHYSWDKTLPYTHLENAFGQSLYICRIGYYTAPKSYTEKYLGIY